MTDKRYNVLWMTSWYPEVTNPVAGVFVREHARAVSAFDNVTVLHIRERLKYLKKTWELEKEKNPAITWDIPTYHYRSRQTQFPIVSGLLFLIGLVKSISASNQKGSSLDLIHAHTFRAGFSSAFVANYFKVPMVITEHSTIFPSNRLNPLNKFKAQLAYKAAKVVMPVSDLLQQSIQAYGISANYKVIGNTFDPEIFYYRQRGIETGICQIITACILKPEKRIELLLSALSQLPDTSPSWNLSIVGTGPSEQHLRSITHELGIQDKVEFLGVLTKHQLAERLRQADFFVLPSQYETFSVATLEAMACGLPVLVTRSGGPEEFVTDETGILVPTEDLDAFKSGLLYLLTKSGNFDRKKIALSVLERFSYETIGLQIHKIYSTLLDK